MNNSLIALAMLCVSPVENFGAVTVANRVPAICSTVLGSPPLPVSVSEMGYNDTAEALQALPAKKATKAPAKPRKASTVKRKRSGGCKPGRWRDARGRCGIWR